MAGKTVLVERKFTPEIAGTDLSRIVEALLAHALQRRVRSDYAAADRITTLAHRLTSEWCAFRDSLFVADRPTVYTVQPGDTLSAIARRFGVYAEPSAAGYYAGAVRIAEINRIDDPGHIETGWQIIIPAKATP